ncbi:1,2-phenylacetyl-CoA epoxidase subunit PaaC [Haloarchaeobius sp. TZWWS8]|uniref:1,2-phenylacetyl-CoA epoxidase subunit PaaC n=1 Tax=Haloarchaeobius sp. TZWWS8 TaxID=3446121 RepID=UPI003EB9522F
MAAAELAAPADLSDEEREAVRHQLFRLADDEFVMAERYTEWQVLAPTLESDIALANIAQDEYGHARLWYDLLQDWGAEESELIWERVPGEWRHSTLCELEYESGGWADAIVRSYLYDTAEDIRLKALVDSSYPRIRDRVGKILGEEDYHREHAMSWLERLCEEDESRARVQDALDRLFPYALTLFLPTDEAVDDRIVQLGIRTETLDDMREEWLDEVVPYLESLDLTVDERDLPEAKGRDQTHTDDWSALYDDFTHTYRELGRTKADRIMKDPDDE